MDSVWSALPDSLAFHVISFMSIDTRLFFGVLPGRLPRSSLKISPAVTAISSEMSAVKVDVSPGKVYLIGCTSRNIIYTWSCEKSDASSLGILSLNNSGVSFSDFYQIDV